MKLHSDTSKAGRDALLAGDFRAATECFSQLVAANPQDAAAWLALGQARGGFGDAAGAVEAFDRVLALQPRNIRALIFKADALSRLGNSRAAAAYYQGAVQLVTPALEQELAGDLKRARAMLKHYTAEYEAYLNKTLAHAGYVRGRSAPRFEQAIETMLGRKRTYLSQPRFFYYPGLPNIQFFPREQFPWLDSVEAATADIRDELVGVLGDEKAFTPYIERDPNLPPRNDGGLTNNPNWGAFYLKKNGKDIPENIARCPKTFAALAGVPMPHVSQRCPSVLFSLLRPKMRIPPHNGLINTRLICHLPLIIPEGCGFRVGNETRQWVEGKSWVFDDSIDHEAWNNSGQLRVILIFEAWRPELSEEERNLITALFRAIDAFTGETPNWEI